MDKHEAILRLTPNASFTVYDNDRVEWYSEDITQPTEEEIVQKIAELEYQQEVEVYKEQRASEYPSYADQFDKIFHSGVNAWKTQIRAIKDKYPKQTMDPDVLAERKRQALEDLEASRSSEES